MRRFATLILFISLTVGAGAETLRGPLGPQISVTPIEPARAEGISLETVVLVDIAGDPRFLDAVDLELTSPAPVGDFPGAVSLYVLGPVATQQRAGIVDVVGEQLLMRPLQRAGKSFYQIVLRHDAAPDASPAITRIEGVVEPASFPIAISVVPRMKGLSDALQAAEFSIAARPVTRDIGAIEIRYLREDGTDYAPDSSRAPGFDLSVDGRPVPVQAEYLLEPGLHRIRLSSERFQAQEATVGVERGRTVTTTLPLELALATVVYTAPRGSSVYVNGQALDAPVGDFTVPPGEHTIVVVLGDYTETRTFRVEEQRTYSISLTMDIVVEEIK